jgi:hypothetical protein
MSWYDVRSDAPGTVAEMWAQLLCRQAGLKFLHFGPFRKHFLQMDSWRNVFWKWDRISASCGNTLWYRVRRRFSWRRARATSSTTSVTLGSVAAGPKDHGVGWQRACTRSLGVCLRNAEVPAPKAARGRSVSGGTRSALIQLTPMHIPRRDTTWRRGLGT